MSDAEHARIRFTEPSSYTEAMRTVSAAKIVGARPVRVVSTAGFVHPASLTVHYAWRTQLGHDSWTTGNIEITGPLVPLDGKVNNSVVDYPRITLILNMHNAPEWIRQLVEVHRPASALIIEAPGYSPTVTVGDARQHEPITADGVTITDISSENELRHCLYNVVVTGAPRAKLGHGPNEPDRYITPDTLAVEYRQGGDYRFAGWRATSIAATGPYATADGGLLRGRAVVRPTPEWAADYALAYLPTHIRLVDSNDHTDEAREP